MKPAAILIFPLLKRLLLSFAGILTALFIIELFLRLSGNRASPELGYFPDHPYQADSYVGAIHRPNREGTYRRQEFEVNFRTNSEGFRSSGEFISGAEHPVIAIIGDSLTEALQVDEESTFSILLQNTLREGENQNFNFTDGQVQNYGVSGQGFIQYLQMYRYYVRPHQPKIVVIVVFPLNDFRNSSPTLEAVPWMRPAYQVDEDDTITEILPFTVPVIIEDEPRSTSEGIRRWAQRHLAIYRLLVTEQEESVLQGEGRFPIDYFIYESPWRPEHEQAARYSEWALRNLIAEIREDDALPVVILIPDKIISSDAAWQDLLEQYKALETDRQLDRLRINQFLYRLLAELDVTFLDLTDDFLQADRDGKRLFWQYDGHLNEQGHELVATELYQTIITQELINEP